MCLRNKVNGFKKKWDYQQIRRETRSSACFVFGYSSLGIFEWSRSCLKIIRQSGYIHVSIWFLCNQVQYQRWRLHVSTGHILGYWQSTTYNLDIWKQNKKTCICTILHLCMMQNIFKLSKLLNYTCFHTFHNDCFNPLYTFTLDQTDILM